MTGIHYLDARGPEGMRLYAIGDVHGRRDLLEAMLGQIDAQIAVKAPADWRIILLGDYIDRGPDSKGVLDLIIQRQEADERVIALGGNHDAGFLDFLRDPTPNSLFAGYGGRETALSYGVAADFSSQAQAFATKSDLARAVPDSHLRFLADLPRSTCFGDFFFCHAGVRPGVALDQQNPEDLIWIRDVFLSHPGLLPKVIVHGHTPVSEPEVRANRVNVDTLAYQSGVLTALVIDGVHKELMDVEGQPIAWRR